MPIIDFKAGDALITVTMDAGLYPAVISDIDGPKASASQKSVSYFVKLRITGGKFIGKELDVCFNSGTKAPSMMGTMQFVPHATFLQVEAAIKNTKVEPVDRPGFNTDDLLNKPLTIQIAVVPDDTGGRLQNMVVGFLPAGAEKASAATPFG